MENSCNMLKKEQKVLAQPTKEQVKDVITVSDGQTAKTGN